MNALMGWLRLRVAALVTAALCCAAVAGAVRLPTDVPASAQAPSGPRNVILILSDDHRYDFMGFMAAAPSWLETPHLDRLAAGGAHLQNAFVTTALCSPSRASILTGRYAHRHGIVDNTSPIPTGTTFFPQYLQKAGYATSYVGKWHMGEEDDAPQPGFDHWVSFRGQGVYVDPELNINGTRQRLTGFTTDILTDQALSWLRNHRRQSPGQPFFLSLSHKAVHAEFVPAPRHRGRYATAPIPYPETMANTEANYRAKPRWVREQRGSWHGVDFLYHGAMSFDAFYRAYAETLLGLDESVGRVLDYLNESGLARSTLVLYMGDNGFLLGEHGLIDKRHAYEESMRVPMLAYAPGYVPPGSKVDALVRNIDVAPTVLALTGVESGHEMDGRSFLPALRGLPLADEGEFLYEYYWEYAFPQTPTVFALRGERYKYILYHGVWDLQELYDLQTDPRERYNLVGVPEHQARVKQMRARLFDRLEAADAMRVPVRRGDFQAAERLGH
jgi:N-acetylglucosamine-6-sulfatase